VPAVRGDHRRPGRQRPDLPAHRPVRLAAALGRQSGVGDQQRQCTPGGRVPARQVPRAAGRPRSARRQGLYFTDARARRGSTPAGPIFPDCAANGSAASQSQQAIGRLLCALGDVGTPVCPSSAALHHRRITEFRRFACGPPSRPAMLSSGTEHRRGTANAAKDHKRDQRSAGPKAAPVGQRVSGHQHDDGKLRGFSA
jgi:hypothetical protein